MAHRQRQSSRNVSYRAPAAEVPAPRVTFPSVPFRGPQSGEGRADKALACENLHLPSFTSLRRRYNYDVRPSAASSSLPSSTDLTLISYLLCRPFFYI
jgi:hypothetical protein